MIHKNIITTLAFLLCITAGAKAQTGEIGLELMWEQKAGLKYNFCKYSHDGQFIYIVDDSKLYRLSASSGEIIDTFDNSGVNLNHFNNSQKLAIAPNDRYNIVSTLSSLTYWDTENLSSRTISAEDLQIKDRVFGVYDFEISPDSKYIYVALHNTGRFGIDDDYTQIVIYDIESESVIGEFEGLNEAKLYEVKDMELSPNGEYLYVASDPLNYVDKEHFGLFQLSVEDRKVVKEIDSNRLCQSISINKSGTIVSAVFFDGREFFNIDNGEKWYLNDTDEYSVMDLFYINDDLFVLEEIKNPQAEHRVFAIFKNREKLFTSDQFRYIFDLDVSGNEENFKIMVTSGLTLHQYHGVLTDIPEFGVEQSVRIMNDNKSIRIEGLSEINDFQQYSIIDLSGNIVQEGELFNNEPEILINLSSGTYFFIMEIDGKSISRKFQVMQ